MSWNRKHLISVDELTKQDVRDIFTSALSMKDILGRRIKKVPTLKGRTVCLLFYEPSTRTRMSFELACKYLGADTISFSPSTSAIRKGETFLDTIWNLERMGIDAFVIRHSSSYILNWLKKHTSRKLLNAGDGKHEHPTQALLDAFTIEQFKGSLEGLSILIVGDVLHSRVARSNIKLFGKLGASVHLCGPANLVPDEFEDMGVRIYRHLEDILPHVDVIYVLRLQSERQKSSLIPSLREYNELYGIKKRHLEMLKSDALIMHPGPMNREVEIDSEVANSEFSVILDQVENGIAIRMAVLYTMLI